MAETVTDLIRRTLAELARVNDLPTRVPQRYTCDFFVDQEGIVYVQREECRPVAPAADITPGGPNLSAEDLRRIDAAAKRYLEWHITTDVLAAARAAELAATPEAFELLDFAKDVRVLIDRLRTARMAMSQAMTGLESEDPEQHKAAFYKLQDEFDGVPDEAGT